MEEFNYKSTIKGIQSRMIAQSIRDTANLDFLKSEDAVREVIKSYQDRFKSSKGKLFDAARYVATAGDLIKVETFNEIFQTIYIDLAALYDDLESVSRILDLNLARNKSYFLVIKKRIKDLWQKLRFLRLMIYDGSPSSESFYGSFFNVDAVQIKGANIDKKNGCLHLSKEFKRVFNKSYYIKTIEETTYPEPNDNGGIKHTTSLLNTFAENYNNGPRDMLDNGLWKSQVIANDIPDFILNIGSTTYPLYRSYRGISSIVDIEYVYPVEINRLDLDFYGDKSTKLDAVLYKEYADDEWVRATLADTNYVALDELYGKKTANVKDSAFDVLGIFNITPFTAKHLRLVFNQENYEFIDLKSSDETSVDDKLNEDLSERRYELIKFGSDLDDSLSKPVSDENHSLYHKILDIIDYTTNIEEILDKIDELINPKIKVIAYDYKRTARYELGAWSIEPANEKYNASAGRFISAPYTTNKAITNISISDLNILPDSADANVYINLNGKYKPIIPGEQKMRVEPLYPLDISKYEAFTNWTTGTFVLLDFPIDPSLTDYIYLSINGSAYKQISSYTKVVFLNSRLLYIDTITDPYEAQYAIKYPPALWDSVMLYVLKAKPGVNVPDSVVFDVVSSNRFVLKAFIEEPYWQSRTQRDDYNSRLTLDDMFYVAEAVSTRQEAELWFGTDFNTCLFISDHIKRYFDNKPGSLYNSVVTGGESKSQTSYSAATSYINGTSQASFSDLELIGHLPNVAPLNEIRSI